MIVNDFEYSTGLTNRRAIGKRGWRSFSRRPFGRRLLGLLAAIGTLAFFSPERASAADPHPIDVHVSITATKSLSVNTTFFNFGSLAPSTSSVSVSSITVTNTSSVLIETYTIQGANALSDSGGVAWTLAASTGTDQFALAAQFSNSQPTNSDASWTGDDLTTSALTCSATQFGNGTLAESGSGVNPVNSPTRSLWLRIKTPGVLTDPTSHTVTITLSVL